MKGLLFGLTDLTPHVIGQNRVIDSLALPLLSQQAAQIRVAQQSLHGGRVQVADGLDRVARYSHLQNGVGFE